MAACCGGKCVNHKQSGGNHGAHHQVLPRPTHKTEMPLKKG